MEITTKSIDQFTNCPIYQLKIQIVRYKVQDNLVNRFTSLPVKKDSILKLLNLLFKKLICITSLIVYIPYFLAF
jgi:hypothetical protein